ncbi:flagellar biosynthetic protein FliR [Alicyclobacillus hesperidum subsp. aegles]|uniref:flagellar biosynthetic protein FliR n=1 Tax=Alicyclobacillus hesperidum TaxID=89784 RepID=UPI00222DA0D6|nr:flagellar biosynthetic protein FliR [Alicyclobacillus hesperidum]GLG00576.1 flagellar biosynthetic protein FliR [Alicyclobacillus hesperidum subsp. aegles]
MSAILQHFDLFVLISLRTVAFIVASPLTSIRAWPTWAKIALAFSLSYVAVPSVSGSVPDVMQNPGMFVVDGILEAFVGLLLGFLATWIFSAISIAGQLIDIQIGFSMATLLAPGSGVQSGLIGNFYNLLFTLYFVGLGGLDGLMLTILQSFHAIPVDHAHLPANWPAILLQLMGMVMALGVEIALPVLAALFLSDVTFAFLSRAVPQMNVFVVGLPVKLFAGLAMFAIVMPGTVYLFNQVFMFLFREMQSFMQVLGG